MNEERRKKIKEALSMLSGAKDIIDSVREAEQEAYDNLPESLQASEQGQKMQEAIELLEENSNCCDSIDSDLSDL